MPNNSIKFGIDLLPDSDQTYNLGLVDSSTSTSLRWNIYGTLNGNASTATSWTAAQKIKVILDTQYGTGTNQSETTINGGQTSVQTIAVDGILGTTNGGTGLSSYTQYDILYASATNTLARLNAGTTGGAPLITGASSAAPSWYNGLILTGTAANNYNAAFAGTVSITGATTISGNTTINSNGTLNVAGATILNNTLNVLGNTTVGANNNAKALTVWGTTNLNDTLTITAATPCIILDTSTADKNDWTLQNASGTMTLSDGTRTITGNNSGFTINGNTTIGDSGATSDLTVWGATDLKTTLSVGGATTLSSTLSVGGNATITGNVIPATTNAYTLGTGNTATSPAPDNGQRWQKLYLGTADTYGSNTQPIYWDNGVPATLTTIGDAYTPIYSNAGTLTTVAPVQYATWEIASGNTYVNLEHDAYTDNTYVLSLVVTEGAEYLQSALQWEAITGTGNNVNRLEITTNTAVTGRVAGYVITARGTTLTPTLNPAPLPSS